MRSKVSYDWLPSYIKATRPVLELFKMAGYFPDRPLIFRLSMALQHLQHTVGCGVFTRLLEGVCYIVFTSNEIYLLFTV